MPLPMKKGRLVSMVREDGKLDIVATSDDLDMLLACTHKARPDLKPGSDIIVLEVKDQVLVHDPRKFKICSRLTSEEVAEAIEKLGIDRI